jgi:hypothetical protein
MYTVYEVFQSSGVPTHTRVDIEEHNDSILGFLSTPGEHLIIHGPSKTGKTTLWTSQIGPDHVIKIPCNDRTSLDTVYGDIIDELDVYFTSSQSTDSKIKSGFQAELKAKLYGFLEGGASSKLEGERVKGKTDERILPPTIGARNISKYLKEANKHVVLENIHYSSQEFRSELSKDLHNFSDYDTKWIIVGVQHQADQVFIENRDLVGRLREVKCGVFDWPKAEEVLNTGSKLLNIEFSEALKKSIYRESSGYAALVQDIAKNICLAAPVTSRQDSLTKIDDDELLRVGCRKIANTFAQVYSKFCDDISKGGRSDGSTEKYKWFLKLIRDRDIPHKGLLNTEVYAQIIEMGHTDINQTSVTQGLQYMNKLQTKRNINPPVLEYDEEKSRLFLLDPYFKFCLRWIPNLIEEN